MDEMPCASPARLVNVSWADIALEDLVCKEEGE